MMCLVCGKGHKVIVVMDDLLACFQVLLACQWRFE